MKMRFYDEQGRLIDEADVDKLLEIGEPVDLAGGMWTIVDLGLPQTDWSTGPSGILYHPATVRPR